MRLRSLVVVVALSSGCQQPARPEPTTVLVIPPAPEKNPVEEPSAPEAPAEAQPSEPQPSEPQPAPSDELVDQTWFARSADGHAEVHQTAYRNGKAVRCASTSTWTPPGDDQSVMWKWETCIATTEQLKFVSPNGKRVLVIDPFPASPQGNWKNVEVATLYEHGVRMKGAKAEALVSAAVEVREPSLRFAWVKGHAGQMGEAPHYTSDGKAVEFETVDGHAFRLGFEGEGFPAAPEEKHVFTASAGMYRYEDEKGTVHIVGSRAEAPERYRARAVPVEAEVGVLTMTGPLGGEAPPPSEPKPKSQPPLTASKGPNPQRHLESPRVPTPAELVEQARDTVKQVEEAQRTREGLADEMH